MSATTSPTPRGLRSAASKVPPKLDISSHLLAVPMDRYDVQTLSAATPVQRNTTPDVSFGELKGESLLGSSRSACACLEYISNNDLLTNVKP